jgi:hypothetical protein
MGLTPFTITSTSTTTATSASRSTPNDSLDRQLEFDHLGQSRFLVTSWHTQLARRDICDFFFNTADVAVVVDVDVDVIGPFFVAALPR